MEYAAQISGTGSAFPPKCMTNDEIAARLKTIGIETSDRWIQERTGIAERRISDVTQENETNSSLGARAAMRALKMADKAPQDIDQILYATCSPDTLIPSTACWLQKKIGADNAWAMDINAACSGFVYGLITAEQFIHSGHARTVLVVGAEVLSPFVDWHDRTSCILFGDGAGAAIVEQAPQKSKKRILSSYLTSNGHLSEIFYIPAGGSNLELTPDRYDRKMNKMRMNGREIFKVAVRTLTECALRTLEKKHLNVESLDWLIPHQANLRIIEAVANRLHFPMEKVILNVNRYGNTSAATVPTAMDEAVRDGRIQPGQMILIDAFGAGLTAGAILLRW